MFPLLLFLFAETSHRTSYSYCVATPRRLNTHSNIVIEQSSIECFTIYSTEFHSTRSGFVVDRELFCDNISATGSTHTLEIDFRRTQYSKVWMSPKRNEVCDSYFVSSESADTYDYTRNKMSGQWRPDHQSPTRILQWSVMVVIVGHLVGSLNAVSRENVFLSR